jgi:uncharacterized protein (DUF433 family)
MHCKRKKDQMVATTNNLLGIGLYTPSEAAFYARVLPQKFARWTFGNKSSDAVFHAQRANVEDREVSFLDFMQALAVRAVRIQYPSVPLSAIREAIDNARKMFGVAFPLAVKDHKIHVFSSRMLINIGDIPHPDLVELNQPHRGQRAFHQVVEGFVDNVEFDPENNLAIKFRPVAKIIMDPKIRMGEPIVEGCGYTARALAEAVRIEGSINAAASAYGVSESDVKIAMNYIFDYLQVAA